MEIEGVDRWRRPAVEPPSTSWAFPPADRFSDDDLVAVGGDLEPGTIVRAYRQGLFPMNVNRRLLGWWSPVERAVVPLDAFRPSRSLRRSCRRYHLSVDRAFRTVVEACADPNRAHGWITPAFVDAYCRLHELGWTHSVEVWTDGGQLAGGLYGVRIGGLFAGESMVYRHRDGSKVALVGLVELLRSSAAKLLDVQWMTPHLASLGAVTIDRASYLKKLAAAVAVESAEPMG